MSKPRFQYKTVEHRQNRSQTTPLDVELNKHGSDGWRVVSLTTLEHEFVKDGSNHGHGGYYRTHHIIVLEKPYDPLSDESLTTY
jgi:hypothetical protein